MLSTTSVVTVTIVTRKSNLGMSNCDVSVETSLFLEWRWTLRIVFLVSLTEGRTVLVGSNTGEVFVLELHFQIVVWLHSG